MDPKVKANKDRPTSADYWQRLNQVFEHIDGHLSGELTLASIAEVACYSPYHFHRIFKSLAGETIQQYISRRRIEKAVVELLHSDIDIITLSERYGFNDHSSFTRAFRRFYGLSPSDFRKEHPHKQSKIRPLKRKNGQAYPDAQEYICLMKELRDWTSQHTEIEIKEMPAMHLAYVSCIDPRNMAEAYQRLTHWAAPKGLMREGTRIASIYHDSFKITEEHKVRMSACLELHQPVEPEGEVGLTQIEQGPCVVAYYEITLNDFEKAWTGLFAWMSERGHRKDADRNPYEIYHNDFKEHPEGKAMVEFCIPIVR